MGYLDIVTSLECEALEHSGVIVGLLLGGIFGFALGYVVSSDTAHVVPLSDGIEA